MTFRVGRCPGWAGSLFNPETRKTGRAKKKSKVDKPVGVDRQRKVNEKRKVEEPVGVDSL